MLNFLKSWALSLSGIIVFGSVCEMILPGGVYKKYLHLAIGLMLILTLLTPFVKGGFDAELELPADFSAYAESENMDSRQRAEVIRVYKKKLCDKICSELKKYTDAEVEVKCEICGTEENFGSIESILIIADSTGERKISDEAIDAVCGVYGLSRDSVSIKYIDL